MANFDKSERVETVTVNGADLHVVAIGNGPAILTMHGGLGLSHDYLRPYFDRLSQTHTVIYYDHFGNGRSARPDDYSALTFERLVSDAAGIMDHLGHEKVTLIGHSYGGFIAQAFATKHQNRLDKLVLVDTLPALDAAPTLSGNDDQMAAFGRLFGGPMADDADWRATWNTVVEMYFHKWDAGVGADLDARTVYEHRAWNAAGALLATFNTLEDLPNVATRTLVMAGAQDGITGPAPGAERIASLMPNATCKVFDDAGHYPFIEQEDAFFETLEAWL